VYTSTAITPSKLDPIAANPKKSYNKEPQVIKNENREKNSTNIN